MKFLRAGAIYALANITSAAVPFVLLPLLTRVLGPTEYAQVVGFALLVTLCQTVAGLNAHAALGVVWFQRPRDEIPAFTGTALALALASTLLVASVAVLLLWLAPGIGGGITPGWGAVAAMTAGANVVVQCRLVLWQNQQRPLHSAALQIATSVINVALSLLAVLVFSWGGDGRNAGIAASMLLVAALVVLLFRRASELHWAPDRTQLITLMTFGLPLIVHSLAGVLLGAADRWSVSILLDAHAFGIYGAGAQLGMVMGVLADAFVKAYSPWIYGKLSSGRPEDRHCVVGAVYVAMPAFLGAAALVWGALQTTSALLLGPQYRAAATVLPWFVLGGAFSGIYMCTSGLYFFSGRTSLLAKVTLSSALIGSSTTWSLVGTLGVVGAAIGYAFTQGVLALVTSVVAIRSFDLPWGEPAKALILWWRGAFGSTTQHSAT
jgi:O-antigen/teichoic acid export membrane protein